MGKKQEKSTKVQLSFTLQKSVNDRFLEHCKDNQINKSQLIERLMKDYMDGRDLLGMIGIAKTV